MENLLIYGSIFDMLDELSNEEAGLLFKALNDFRKGNDVEFEDRYLKGLWKGIKPNLDKLKDNYESKVKANQENGKKEKKKKKVKDATSVASNIKIENKATETTISTQPIAEAYLKAKTNLHKIEDIKVIEDEVQITNDIFELTNREIQDMGYSKEKIGNWIVPNAYVPYLHLIQDYKGIIKTLMNEYSQINFEIELRNKLEYYKNKTEIILT